MSKGSGPPPRWLRCPRKGELCHEKFLPFKVPLKAQYDSQVPEEYRFPPRMVFDLMKGRKKKVRTALTLIREFLGPSPSAFSEKKIKNRRW